MAVLRLLARSGQWFVAAGIAAALVFLVKTLHGHYPLQHWLFVRYAGFALLSAYFGAGCLVSGHAILRSILGRVLPVREQLVIAFPIGLLAYFWLAFTAGLFGLLGDVFFGLAPLALMAAGALPSFRYARRLTRHIKHARKQPSTQRGSPLIQVALGLGVLAVAMIWFSVLSPTNASFDARWYHLPLAEHYSSAERIARFPEGWVLGTYPQLASIVYTWAFLLPGARLFDHIALSAQLEVMILLWTLAAVPALARRILPRRRQPGEKRLRMAGAWPAFFLFPGIFLYDSSLNLGADHFAALWAAPIFLAFLRAWRTLGARECAVLALLLSGALLTKYTAIMIAGLPILAVALRALWLTALKLVRFYQGPFPWRGPLVAALLGISLTSAHWLKNWVWYGDPLYPQLQDKLVLRPWLPEAKLPYFTDIAVSWHASRDLAGLLESAKIMFTYAFVHHDWPDLHGKWPIFGFLFTLALAFVPFLGKAPRLWAVFAFGHLSVAMWTMISWQERYLQVLVPWMAAAVAVTVALVWRLHVVPRVLLCALIVVQIAWGSDVYFFTTHRMVRGTPSKASIDLLNTGRVGNYDARHEIFQPLQRIGMWLPEKSVVLAHGSRQTLGLIRARVHDSPGTQGGISYSRMGSPRAVYDALRKMGVTHAAWDGSSEGNDVIAGDLVFYDFVTRHMEKSKPFGSMKVAAMPKKPPTDKPFGQKVAYLACQGRYEPALYKRSDLIVPVYVAPSSPKPLRAFNPTKDKDKDKSEALALMADADYVLFQPDCRRGVPHSALSAFQELGRRGTAVMYARKAKSAAKNEGAAKPDAAAKNDAATKNDAAAKPEDAPKKDAPKKDAPKKDAAPKPQAPPKDAAPTKDAAPSASPPKPK